jgi:hypothetical protein
VTTPQPSHGAPLLVRAYESLEALDGLAPRLDALNLASRRPSPFATLAYLRTFLANDEDAHHGYRPLFLVASEGEAPVGWVALRRQPARLLGLPAHRVEFLVLHDNERPHMACREADEPRCAAAFLRHLLERERGWSLLEWMEQDQGSPLVAAAEAGARGCYLRRFDHNPNATIERSWADAGEYYRSLSKNFRASIRSGVNRLTAAGHIEFASTWAPAAAARLLDLHLDVEGRSWKGPAAAGVSRHPVRVGFFRALMAAGQPMRMGLRLMLLDGVPIACEINGEFGDTWYAMEGTYDEAWRDAGPGHLLFLMTMREALGRGVRAVNLLNNYAYVKRRYGATITETAAVQLFRPWTPLWAKARLGDLRRRLLGRGTTQADVDYNLVKGRREGEGDEAAAPEAARPDRSASRRLAEEVLAGAGGLVERTDVSVLLDILGKSGPARPPKPPRHALEGERAGPPAPG